MSNATAEFSNAIETLGDPVSERFSHCRMNRAQIFSQVTLKVLIHSADEGGFWAEVPALPGCVSQGETMDELRTNVREAIEGWLMAEDDSAKSKSADEVIEVTV